MSEASQESPGKSIFRFTKQRLGPPRDGASWHTFCADSLRLLRQVKDQSLAIKGMTMKTRGIAEWFGNHVWFATVAGIGLLAGANLAAGDLQLAVLKTRTDTFDNVTVYNHSATDIFIRHAKGIASVKFSELDTETLGVLDQSGYLEKAPETTKKALAKAANGKGSSESDGTEAGAVAQLNSQLRQGMEQGMKQFAAQSPVLLGPETLLMVGGLFLVLYLFFCYCLKLICTKAGAEPGALIWLPVLQLFPLLRAAGMSGWWFVAWLIPILNLVAQIFWSFKIVEARGKSVWVAIGLLLPVTNVISLLYLAFSNGAQAEEGNGKLVIAGPPLLAEA